MSDERRLAGMRSEDWFSWVILVVSLFLSFGGIIIAASMGVPSHGGRGGAVAVALTFFFLFLRGTSALRLIEAKEKDDAAYLQRLRQAMAADLDDRKKDRTPLALSSMIGTLVWGFGDLIAAYVV